MQSMPFDHGSSSFGFQRRLPPLHALEVFATAARCGTFSQAARELFVTQSAVSRQIRLLEEHFGLTLFLRHKRGLRLTPEGEILLPVLVDAFAQVTRVCDSLRNAGQVLTLRMPPTIAARWFLPLLPTLREIMPDIDVRVTTYDAWEPRFENSDIDAAIIQGKGSWPGLEAILLMPELLTPVCSPDLARQLRSVGDLVGMPFLHCHPLQAWQLWLEAENDLRIASHRGQTFDTLELALSAATRGQGIAMGDLNLMRESLRDGILVTPFTRYLDRGFSYYLVYPAQRGQQQKIRQLRDALAAAAASASIQPT